MVVSADDAQRWMDMERPDDEAVHLALTQMLSAELFEWRPTPI